MFSKLPEVEYIWVRKTQDIDGGGADPFEYGSIISTVFEERGKGHFRRAGN